MFKVVVLVISLACFTSETLNMQAFLFFVCTSKAGLWSEAFLAENVETGGKNRNTSQLYSLLRKLRKD